MARKDGPNRAPEECWIWLIWGLKKGQIDLLAIASHEKARDRYKDFGERNAYVVHIEEVMTDHLYGQSMLGSARGRKSFV